MTQPIPTLVIGGFLGAGKTSLVNHLLRHAASPAGGQRIAVLVNDFGSINIDAELITGQQGEVMSLAGGCVCCSFGADLVGTLNTVAQREPPPDVVLIEASGVALPAQLARSAALAFAVHVEGIVVLADAEQVRAQCQDRYTGDVLRQQLFDADVLLLNKVDLVDAAQAAALLAWLPSTASRATVLPCTQGQVPHEVVLGLRVNSSLKTHTASTTSAAQFVQNLNRVSSADERFISACLTLPGPVDVQATVQTLAAKSQGLLRAKGFATDLSGQCRLVHAVGSRWSTAPWAGPAPNNAHDTIVAIGVRGVFDAAAWAAL